VSVANPAGPDDKDAVSQFNDPSLMWASPEQVQPAQPAYGHPGGYQTGEYYRQARPSPVFPLDAGRPPSRWPLILAIVVALAAAIAALVVVLVH
jgi:hypothetical protein